MALTQVKSDGIATGAVTADQIATGAVTANDLEDSGVTAGTYGSSSAIPAITVDAKGRVTAAATNAINVQSDQIFEGNTTVECVDTGSDGHITFDTEGTERARIDSSGRVAIGTTSPDFFSTNANNLVIREAGNGGLTIATPSAVGAIVFNDTDNTTEQGAIKYEHSTNSMQFVANSSERARIDSSGRVGIGTSSPAVTVHAEAAQAELQLKSTSGTNSAGLRFVPGGETNALYIYADGSRNINIDNHATSIASFRAGGGLTFNGDTASANALDDYEQGTWTPTFQYQSGGVWYDVGYANGLDHSTGSYVKIGNLVYFSYYSGNFQLTSASQGADARITGLPYAAYNDAGTYSGAVFYHTNPFQQTINSGYIEIGQDIVYPVQNSSTSRATWGTSSGRYLMVSGTYRTT